MNQSYSTKERAHIAKVKELSCSVCDKTGPSEAHHIRQDNPYTCIALCADCHRGSHNGIHGRMALWNVYRMDELTALTVTLTRLLP
jgi:hypothetical protein